MVNKSIVTQKGFGLVPTLLILLLITAVGFTGYYVYNQQSNNKTDKSEVAGDTTTKTIPTPTSSVDTKPTITPTTMPSPTAKPSMLSIPELGLSLNLQDSPYNDVKYAIINNGQMAAIYSQQLFDKQVAAAKKAGMVVSDSNVDLKFGCSRAVYAYFQKYTGMGLDGYEIISPNNKPKDASLYVGGYGACDPGPGLADEYSAFMTWVKNNLKQ